MEPLPAGLQPGRVIDGGATYTREPIPHGPVPERPLHLCPTCDYILTGLSTYRCPECGNPFTLSEARFRAVEKSPEFKRVLWRAQLSHSTGVIGLVLLVVAAVLPLIVASYAVPAPLTLVTPLAVTIWVVMAGTLLAAMIAVAYLGTGLSHALLVTGLLDLGLAVLFCFL